ncbi:MAG TPA: DHA2 family efflux MFS transporter permease subunit [Candidatus Sulfopaludibacter sp.]|jgi:DHA2 family multidrug resistance protein|nr:DHA2 family efflux MFS transporter permease subunit [Candidatus Sulfopaludibacter sp.]
MPGEQGGRWQPSHNPWLIALAVMLATFMEVMDTSIAAVAVPYIAGSVSATYNEATWVLTSYLVANAVFLPSSTWFSRRFGRKRFLMFSVLVFTIASFGCGIAGSLGFILLARAIQGAGGGALQPISQAILMESFPPEKQGQALGLFAMGVVVAPVIGPAFGGYLTDAISWRWAFYINIPVGILALILQQKFLEDPPYIRKSDPGRLDGIGLGLLAIWSGSMQFICDKGQEEDWFGSSRIRWALVFFVLAFVFFLVREMTHDKPLLNLRVLANRNFGGGCFLIFLFGACVYSITTILPLFYQTLMGYNATTAGLAVSPRGLGSLVGALIAGRLVAKLDVRKLVAFAFIVLAAANLWNGSLTLQISPWSLFWPIVITGFAFPLIFVPLSGVALGTLPQEELGNASGLYNLLRNLGGSIGIAAANTIAQRHLQTHRSEMVHSLSAGSLELRHALSRLTMLMQAHAGPVKASLRSAAILQRSLDNQAQLWAYVDVFRYLAIVCAVCVPVTFILKKAQRKAAAG